MAYVTNLIETYPDFGPELTTDGNMEDDPTTNWPAAGGAAVAVNTVTVRNGCQSLQVTDGGAGGGYASQSITVEAGERYKIDVWGYSAAAGDTWRARIYVGASVVWTSDTHDVTAPVDWEKETKFYRVPDGITTIVLRLEVVGAAKIVYFDDISVRREPPVPMTTIDLMFRAVDDWSLLDRGLLINDPAIKEIWGGELEDQLVRREEGKRVIPLQLYVGSSSADDLIDTVNALEEMLRHAARHRKDGWGGEVFLEFKTDGATYNNWYPVICGQIDKSALMKICCSDEEIDRVPVVIICEAYWEADVTYDLENLLDNPGFEEWNNGICDSEPDNWDDLESVAAGTGTNNQETDTVEEGCEALRIEVAAINNADFKGISQDITARLRADTEYTLLVWVQNAVITGGRIDVYATGSASGILGQALASGAANATYTQYSCQFTPAAADIAGNVWIYVLIVATATPCTGIAHIDKMLVVEASNVPTGWMSSSYLVNQYDRDECDINWLSVTDIPGEVEAEARYEVLLDENTKYLRMAKRTRNDPCAFPWQLIPCEGYTEFETGASAGCQPGLIDAVANDSDKVGDANSPSGSNITVDFAVTQTMAYRCEWSITDDLFSHLGKFALVVLARATGSTDTIKMKIITDDEYNTQGFVITQTVPFVAAGSWIVLDGWTLLSYRAGTSDDVLFGTGNNWAIALYAEHVSADGITDTLEIAGAYLVPIEEAYMIAGGVGLFGAGIIMIVKEMDGDRGVFGYRATTDTYYPNVGMVGTIPTLTPEVENRLYFITEDDPGVQIADTFRVSMKYRPQGIFLRGSNP